MLEHQVNLFIISDQNPLALLKHTWIMGSKMCFIKQNYHFHTLFPSTIALPSFCLSHKSAPHIPAATTSFSPSVPKTMMVTTARQLDSDHF